MVDSLKRGSALALAVVLVTLIVVVGFGRSSSTEAAWFDDQRGLGTFQAETLGTINKFNCHTNYTVPLLVRNEITLTWDELPVAKGYKIEYRVSWDDGTPRGDKGSKPLDSPRFVYKPKPLDAFARVDFTIQAKLKGTEWQTPAVTGSASGWTTTNFSCDSFK